MKTRVNWRLVLGTVAILAVAGVCVHVLHAVQLRRNAGSLREQAIQAVEDGKPDRAARFFSAYLDLVPEDLATQAEYADALQKVGTQSARLRSVAVLDRVLKKQPERHDLRRRLIATAVELNQPVVARTHLEALLQAHPDDGEAEYYLGRLDEDARNYRTAAEWYEKAATHRPDLIEAQSRLAFLLRRHLEQPEKGDEVIDRMVATHDRNWQAYFERGRYRRAIVAGRHALEDFQEAARLSPGRPNLLWPIVEVAWALDDFAALRTTLRQLEELRPNEARPYHLHARLEHQAGRLREAEAILRRGIEKTSSHEADLGFDLADLLLQMDRPTDAAEWVTRLEKTDCPPNWVAFLKADLQQRQRQRAEAAQALEDLRRRPGLGADLLARVNRTLARCHGQLGDLEQQLSAARRAVAAEPLSAVARAELGSALVAVSRTAEAVTEYRQAVRLAGPPAWARREFVRAMLTSNRGRPAAQRDWTELEQQLAEAERRAPSDVRLITLRAEVLAARGEGTKARELLEKARDKQPERVELWVALAWLAQEQRKPDEALEILQAAKEKLGDRVELRLARARHWLGRGAEAARTRLPELEQDVDRLSVEERAALLSGLAELHLVAGSKPEAARLLQNVAALQPQELRWRLMLVDLAMASGPDAVVQTAVADLRRAEGEEGVLWRYAEAVRLLQRARRGDAKALTEARNLHSQLVAKRPSWSRLALLAAHLDEVEQKPEQALENYLRAIELGDRQVTVLDRTRQLLAEHDPQGKRAAALSELKP